MRKLLGLGVAVAATAALVGTAAASHSWGGYHWARTSTPFTLKVGDNVSSTWDAYLDEAIADWSASTVLDLTKVAGGARGNCRPTNGRIEVCNSTYGNNGWLGLAQIWITGGTHITQATTKLNDTYFNTPTYNTHGWRSLVICQEPGHDLGLGHQDENFNNTPISPHTCMDYFVPGASEEVDPNQHDYDQLVSIYAHNDSSSTVGQVKLPGNAKPFSQASRANGSVYVDHLPGGVTLLTHVFWTPDGS